MLPGIHHLALVTDDKRMTLDFYVRVLGMPIVHGLRTPSRLPSGSRAHGKGAPPYANRNALQKHGAEVVAYPYSAGSSSLGGPRGRGVS
jgi:catechol 2,3-dioxygenase-like lactoylglutathione lyase family enzyme